MQEEIAMQISQRVRALRQEKKITLDELARRAQVSKSLISQVENNRTIPSLPVLISLIQSLEIDIHAFFDGIGRGAAGARVLLRRKADYQPFHKELVKGFHYQRILSKAVAGQLVDFVWLELEPGARRASLIRTDAWEFKYVVSGTVDYTIGRETLRLEAGDSLFFDASQPHSPANPGPEPVRMLVVYFFREADSSGKS